MGALQMQGQAHSRVPIPSGYCKDSNKGVGNLPQRMVWGCPEGELGRSCGFRGVLTLLFWQRVSG